MYDEIIKSDCSISGRRPPLLDTLEKQREQKQTELDDLDAAIKALKDNPEFEKMINILGKVTRI